MAADQAKEAMMYRPAADPARPEDSGSEGKAVDCFLCGHRCHIRPGKRGFCSVRENRDGKLYSLVYGMLISANVDPIEKKPLYHFIPGTKSYSIATMGCNFKCSFCQNWEISQGARGEAKIPGRYTEPEVIVQGAASTGCASIAYTYTEPTIFYEFAHDCAVLAHERDIKNVFVTNGYETPETIENMAGLIDAANVDLKSFSDDFYKKFCGARLNPVLEAIRRMHEAGIFIEVTTLLIPDSNDSEEELRSIAEFLAGISRDIPWHISRFFPQYKTTHIGPTPAETILRAAELGEKAGLRFIYTGNMPTQGKYVDTVCPDCGATVIARHGYSTNITNLTDDRCGKCGHSLPLIVS